MLSVLLLINSSSVKKYGRSFTAHLCHSFSFPKAVWTASTFLGVTQVLRTSLPTGVCAVDAVLLLVLVADNGIGMAGISVVSLVGCVAGTGGTVDSISNSLSRKVAMVSISIISRSSCGKESKFSLPLNCGKQRQLTNGVYSAFHTAFDEWFRKFT